jgi:hypothetical protein
VASHKLPRHGHDRSLLCVLGSPRGYCELRRLGAPIEQAFVLLGQEFRLRQAAYHLALR